MEVQLEQFETKGAAFINIDGKREAEMTYSIASPELIIIDHTDVSDMLSGKGIGRQLLHAIIDKARAENIKILPLCPYARSVFLREKSIQDVLK